MTATVAARVGEVMRGTLQAARLRHKDRFGCGVRLRRWCGSARAPNLLDAAGLLHRDLEVLAEASREARLTQGQVVVPHPDKPLVEPERADLVEPAEERRPPRGERAHVVGRDVGHAAD